MKYAKSVSTVIRILIVFNLIGFAVLFLGESVQPFIPQDNGFWMSLSFAGSVLRMLQSCCIPLYTAVALYAVWLLIERMAEGRTDE
ncbi:hypothetical protein [uncultured Faecalibaculum sp.]|uniref:hypothetical protein n=1 Tax=uncultured Faecalibaculum sp. TaxID=1729681 RepID=UPI0025E33DBD|nr:hypothetical protein [uncultured Faecalibaculum sp.]